jgi:drug/metabolite transporter (DMT)-like permease
MTQSTPDTRPMSPAAWGALAIVYVVWGSTYLGIRIAIETMPPLLSGAVRFLVAALLLAGFLAVRQGAGVLRASPSRVASAALVGILLLTGGNGMVSVAEEHLASGLAALLVASVPLWLVVLRTMSGDRPPAATLAGVGIGFAGVALLSLLGHGGSGSVEGMVIILLASMSWAVGSFLSGRLPLPGHSLTTSVYEMAAGGLTLLVLAAARGEHVDVSQISARSWIALAYLIVFGSLVAFTAYSWLLGNAPISLVGTYAYVNPAVAVFLGALVLDEPVTWTVVLGGAVIIAGVGIVVSTERRGRPPGRPTAPSAVRHSRAPAGADRPAR